MDAREKVIHLFQYIRELNKMRSKNITNFIAPNSYEWKLFFSEIPESAEWVSLSYKDVDGEEPSNIILTVRKPQLPLCPVPDECLDGWLCRGYD